jgi:hypothetical protein
MFPDSSNLYSRNVHRSFMAMRSLCGIRLTCGSVTMRCQPRMWLCHCHSHFRAVKGAGLAFIGAERRALTERADRWRRLAQEERFRNGEGWWDKKKRAAATRRGPPKLSELFYLVVLAFEGSRRPGRVFGEVLLLVSPPFVFLFLVKSARTAAATLPMSIL